MATLTPDAPLEALPSFPFSRTPFHPPREFQESQNDPWLTPVRMWDGRRAWLVTRLEDVRLLLGDRRLSANPANPGFPAVSETRAALFKNDNPSFVRYDGADHSRIRKMLMPEFTVPRVMSWRNAIEQMTDELIDVMLSGPKPVDFRQTFASKLPSDVMCLILGVSHEDYETFRDCSDRLVDIGSAPEENIRADADFRAAVSKLVEQRTQDLSGDDLTTRLIRDQYLQGQLTEKELLANLQILFLGGFETTANTLAHCIILLTQDREAWDALGTSDDPIFIRTAVEELLRFTSVVQYQCQRVAVEDFEYRGRTIQKGDGILSMIHGANRDPAVFDKPDELDIFRRTRNPHLAFGFGPHQCIGQALARLELAIALPALAKRVPTLRLAGTLDDIIFKGSAITHGVSNVQVTW